MPYDIAVIHTEEKSLPDIEQQRAPYTDVGVMSMPSYLSVLTKDETPGELNAAIMSADALWVIVLEGSDKLPPDFLYRMWYGHMGKPANAEQAMCFRRAPVQYITDSLERVEFTKCSPTNLRTLRHPVNEYMPVLNSCMFPKNAWKMVHGFDPHIQPLHYLDLWIKLVRVGLVCKAANATCLLKSGERPKTGSEVLQNFNNRYRIALE